MDNHGRWRKMDTSECPSNLTRWTMVDVDERMRANPVCAFNATWGLARIGTYCLILSALSVVQTWWPWRQQRRQPGRWL